jgi:BirA family biotin operon repressor/biotin-[acetyl-CoA-carboxylase] ligase
VNWGERLQVGECESTQALLLDADLPEGTVATADHQTAGRGRLGRSWVEAPGTSVLCSVLLRPPAERPLPQLSLVAGLAAAEAVELATGLAAQIKWPNDVMLNRRKVAGVLAEASLGAAVVGIGINVNQTRDQLPPGTRVPAGSLRTLTGREHDREEVLAALLGRLGARYDEWKAGGLDALYGELGARDFLRGRHVLVGGVRGLAAGIDRAGRLLVGDTAVESGEVEYDR